MKTVLKGMLLGVLLLAPGMRAEEAADGASDATTATVLEFTGHASYEDEDGKPQPLEAGQLLSEGDHVITGPGSSLHLVLADGSSLALGENTEMTLDKIGAGNPGSQTFLQVLKGAAHAFVQKLKGGSAFEVSSSSAVAAVKGTDFELSQDEGGQGAVTVEEGVVAMSDKNHANTVEVPALHRSAIEGGKPAPARHLSAEEAGRFHQKWQHARESHAKRVEMMKPFAARIKERREALKKRLPLLHKRLESRRAAMREDMHQGRPGIHEEHRVKRHRRPKHEAAKREHEAPK